MKGDESFLTRPGLPLVLAKSCVEGGGPIRQPRGQSLDQLDRSAGIARQAGGEGRTLLQLKLSQSGLAEAEADDVGCGRGGSMIPRPERALIEEVRFCKG